MLIALVLIFVVAYAAIALEHPLRVNKSASALIGAGLLWTIYAMLDGDHHLVSENLNESVAATAQIVFFLMGAMTIVEVVDAHNGFSVITSRIRTTRLTSLLWLVGNILHRNKEDEFKAHLTLVSALKRIDISCIVFFIGILLAVATLEHTHILAALAQWLDTTVGRQDIIVTLIGLASSVVDNVPLVAASMGMYSMTTNPPDSFLWEFMAYCAGTGGSILIIGSAAGVAAMGLEKIHFFWYAKRIGGLATLGYFAGIFVYIMQHKLMHG